MFGKFEFLSFFNWFFFFCFFRHVFFVSKWKLDCRIGIHVGDLVYILNDDNSSIVKIKQSETNTNCSTKEFLDNQKKSSSVQHIYGNALFYAKYLKNNCLPK